MTKCTKCNKNTLSLKRMRDVDVCRDCGADKPENERKNVGSKMRQLKLTKSEKLTAINALNSYGTKESKRVCQLILTSEVIILGG